VITFLFAAIYKILPAVRLPSPCLPGNWESPR
jgi:hypothetical protein